MIIIKALKNFITKRPKKKNFRFETISWMQEKKLKHQDITLLKNISLSKLKFYYKNPFEFLHSYPDIFLQEIYRFTSAQTNPVIIDCGSNIGLSILYFKQIFPNSKIFGFEADINNFNILKQNIETNGCTQVQIFNKAVWINDHGVSFNNAGTESSRILIDNENKQTANIVPSIDLNNFLQEFEKIDFLKVDVEGAEYEIFKHIQPQQLAKVDNLFLEYHGKSFETYKLNTIIDIISKHGFSLYIKTAADFLEEPFINKTTDSIYDVQLNLFFYKQN